MVQVYIFEGGIRKVNAMEEKILVMDRDYLFSNERLAFQGIETNEERMKKIFGRFGAFFEAKRGDAEYREKWKQPIPFVVILRGNEIFLHEKLKAGNEPRLHGQLSIGVGGHMNLLDDSCRWRSNLRLNMYKELREELHIAHTGPEVEPQLIGILNNDGDDVGKYHIGLIHIMELPDDALVSVKETDKLDGYWVRLQDIRKPPLYQGLETWSKMIADILENII